MGVSLLEQTEHQEPVQDDLNLASDESPVEEKQVDPEVEKEKAKRRLSDRLKEQTFHRRQAERENEQLKRQVAELSAKTAIKAEPDPEDYADRNAYNSDREAWKKQEREKITAEVEEKLRTDAKKSEYQKQLDAQKAGYIEGRAEAIKDDPKYHEYEKDIDKVVESFDAPEIQDLILAAGKQGPKIVKYLGANPDELEEIADSSPRERTFLMGKLVAKLEAKPVKTISSAPNPTRSEKGGATRAAAPTGKAFDSSKETFKEFSARQNRLR